LSGDAANGIGVSASGGKAALFLAPRASAGAPTTGLHAQGEVVVDNTGAIFVCKVGNNTGVGTWMRLGFNPLNPVRVVDTRASNPPDPSGEHALASGEELVVDIIGGLAPVPLGATAVAVNITAVSPTAAGYLASYPADLTFSAASPPGSSTVNFPAQVVAIANGATVKLAGPGQANAGKIKVFNSAGTTHVVVDVVGFFS
jgi:hypothetical protein